METSRKSPCWCPNVQLLFWPLWKWPFSSFIAIHSNIYMKAWNLNGKSVTMSNIFRIFKFILYHYSGFRTNRRMDQNWCRTERKLHKLGFRLFHQCSGFLLYLHFHCIDNGSGFFLQRWQIWSSFSSSYGVRYLKF